MLRKLLVAAAAASMWALALPAAAQAPAPTQTPAPAGPDLLRVAAMTPFIDGTAKPPRPFVLKLQISNTTESTLQGVSVGVTFFRPVLSRTELRVALDGGTPTGATGTPLQQSVPGAIEPGAQREVDFAEPLAALRPYLPGTGVYPLQITVSYADGSESLTTAVPFIGSVPQARLNVTWVLPVTRPTVLGVDGSYSIDSLHALALDELQQQASVIARRPGLPITLAIDPSMLDPIGDLAAGAGAPQGAQPLPAGTAATAQSVLQTLRAASASSGETALVPYAPVSAPSLVHHGMSAEFAQQLQLGRDVVQARTGRAPSPSILAPPDLTLDRTSAAQSAQAGVTGLILDQSVVGTVPPDQRLRTDLFGPSEPVAVTAGGERFSALLPDPNIEQRLDDATQGVLLGQAITAETASAWLELPSLAASRLIVITSHRMPSPTTLADAVDGLRLAPWVKLRTASDALASLPVLLPGQTPPAQVALPVLAPPDRAYLRSARVARRALLALQSMTRNGQLQFVDRFDRVILAGESAEWEPDGARGASLIQPVLARVRGMLTAVRVAGGRHVTLTSRAGSVPVTVLNGNDFPVQVRVVLSSTKLDFPHGVSRVLQLDARSTRQASTLDYTVETRTTGSFPIEVRITTPDGRTTLSTGEILVRSTAVSAVALTVTGGGALFLLFAWARRGARRRRSVRTVPPPPDPR